MDKQLNEAAIDYAYKRFLNQIGQHWTKQELMSSSFVDGAKYKRERDKWVKVQDDLPEQDETVIIVVKLLKGSYVTVGWLSDGFWQTNESEHDTVNATHWQPFPALPQKPNE